MKNYTTKITQQRMQNLQAITHEKCIFEVIDKNKTEGETGVLVRIDLPFKKDE